MSGKYWDRAWSLIDGCTPVSAGCDNCWAAGMQHRFRAGELTDPKGDWVGKVVPRYDRLDIPSRTKRPTVFSVWNDLMHPDVPDGFIYKAFDAMCENRQHTYLILTKRPKRMLYWAGEYMNKYCVDAFPCHIWFGISAENQAALDERLPHLLWVPGKRFLSLEPLLEAIDLTGELGDIDSVIVGAETGSHKRECKPEWINSIVAQCKEAGIPVWVKAAPEGVEIVRERGW